MRFNSKNTNYITKNNTGVLPSAFIKDVFRQSGNDDLYFKVTYAMFFVNETNEIQTPYQGELVFTDNQHRPTIILNENGEPQEIIEFLTGGGTYDPAKVVDWGWPSAKNVKEYFDLESVWGGLTFKEGPFKQLAIDWVMNNLAMDGNTIAQDFEYVE